MLAYADNAGVRDARQGSHWQLFLDAYFTRLRQKLGLTTNQPDDDKLVQDFLDLLENSGSDFTLAFRRLGELPVGAGDIEPLFDFNESFEPWLERWRQRCALESIDDSERHAQMMATNPALIPRNHLVEAAIEAAYAGDFAPFHALTERLARPFEYSAEDEPLALPPRPEQVVQQTFCGT